MSFVAYLECALCGHHYEPTRVWNMCTECERPLLVRYDLDAVGRAVKKEKFASRAPTLWRYQELLPVNGLHNILTLGEGFTPLVRAGRLAEEIDFPNLFIKDEGLNPTGSFKVRGLALAVSRARELGIRSLSIPSAGNAATAMSAYAAAGGMEAFVYMPSDVPAPFIAECEDLGAHVTLVDGLITDCGRVASEDAKKFGRFDMSTLKEPYRVEGKKTMGMEIAEQMAWTLPDVIIYPTGGGTGLIGMWKAFLEMETLGWISDQRPRMVSVQSDGCAPMVKAFESGSEFAEPWEGASTIADGLRVPAAVGDFLILRALRESNGAAVAVSDAQMIDGANMMARTQMISASPEGGASLAALMHLRETGFIGKEDQVVLFNTGSGHKYAHLWKS